MFNRLDRLALVEAFDDKAAEEQVMSHAADRFSYPIAVIRSQLGTAYNMAFDSLSSASRPHSIWPVHFYGRRAPLAELNRDLSASVRA
jgi:hypothetical protein